MSTTPSLLRAAQLIDRLIAARATRHRRARAAAREHRRLRGRPRLA